MYSQKGGQVGTRRNKSPKSREAAQAAAKSAPRKTTMRSSAIVLSALVQFHPQPPRSACIAALLASCAGFVVRTVSAQTRDREPADLGRNAVSEAGRLHVRPCVRISVGPVCQLIRQCLSRLAAGCVHGGIQCVAVEGIRRPISCIVARFAHAASQRHRVLPADSSGCGRALC